MAISTTPVSSSKSHGAVTRPDQSLQTGLYFGFYGEYYAEFLACIEQFRVMAFAKPTVRESLCKTEVCLSTLTTKLHRIEFPVPDKRSTLADAHETRDGRIYAEFADCLIAQARKLYIADSFGAELENTAYALDSTTWH